MAQTTPAPLLELQDEEATRPFLTLKGTRYDFSLQSDLSLQDLATVKRVGLSMQRLGVDDPSPELIEEVARDLRTGVTIAMHDMPSEVVDTLRDSECLAIIEAFTKALPDQGANPAAPSPTTPSDSPTSTASTPNES